MLYLCEKRFYMYILHRKVSPCQAIAISEVNVHEAENINSIGRNIEFTWTDIKAELMAKRGANYADFPNIDVQCSSPILLCNDQVYIVGHTPPGVDDHEIGAAALNEKHNTKYLQTVRLYSDIIRGQFFGHWHSDTFRVIYNDMGKIWNKNLYPK